MALYFDMASTAYATVASAADINGAKSSVSFFVKFQSAISGWNADARVLEVGGYSYRNTTGGFSFERSGASSNVIFVAVNGSYATLYTHSAPSTGVWYHYCITSDTTGPSNIAYLDGSSVATDATQTRATGSVPVNFAAYDAAKTSLNGDVHIAEFALYNEILDASEVAALAKGFSPQLVRRASLARYVPGVREFSDLRTGTSMTNSGGVASSHPRVIYPRRRSISVPTVAAGGLSIPVAMHNYRRRRTA